MDTFGTIRKIIAETIHIDEAAVTCDLSVGGISEWDSMGNVAIIAAIEEQLQIEFPIEDLFELNSVTSLVEAVNKIKQ